MEKEIQEFWKSEHAYEKTKELREKGEKFYFVDGPPYTTGAIHLGTALNKTVKDILIRYWRMNGYNVRDQPGFDMHGLPIEVKVEKSIGVHSKKQIEEEIGIDKFVRTCQEFALGLHASMTEQFKQLGAWLDWDRPYQTLRLDYMESAWWTCQQAFKKGLLKDSSRVVTWCPRCETALAEAEIDYSDETDPSVMVRFPLKDDASTSLLIWTTTPWTLPSNMAVAVHPDETYAKVKFSGDSGSENVIIMKSQIEYVMNAGGYSSFEILQEYNGKDLIGTAYMPPFEIGDGLQRTDYTYKVVDAPYVEKDNTGLVHTAPGFGPDDFDTGKRYGLVPFCPVDEAGRFTDDFPLMAGKKVRTVNEDVISYLKERNLLFSTSKIKHRYGHCWRCKTPIIFRNTRQWFIEVPKVKEKMLSEVDRVKWTPDWAGSSREKNWVENARDWCVSRQRYWGIPLPIWECECGEKKVVGQYDEMREGQGYTEGMDTHRPWIDKVTFTCPKCGKTMHRIPDVMDVWFDSGVAPWADLGYPHKKDEFEKWWPPKFIVEAHDQTRGWFYTTLASGVVSFDRAPYDEIMMHAWMLDSKGRKMSKSLGNVVEPLEVISQYGADALRFYLVMNNAPWEDTCFQKNGPKDAWKVLNTFWNVVNFAAMYMSIDKYDPEKYDLETIRPHLRDEDLWMLSRTEKMKAAVTASLETKELQKVARALSDYILEDLSRWYLHLVRDRSWDEESSEDKMASYFMLHRAIMSATIALAPLCPHITEKIYSAMGGKLLSVHMEDWQVADERLYNEDLEHSMRLIQNIIEIIANERAKMGSKLRWPLKAVYVRGNDEKVNAAVKVFDAVLAQQGNLKLVDYLPAGGEVVGNGDIEPVAFDEGELFIDFEVTPEIEAEGYSRELIRRIQQMRKEMKLNVEDFIVCDVKAEDHLVELFRMWMDHICTEVRSKKIEFSEAPEGDSVKEWDITGKNIVIGVSKS
ncbi:isoleucyl-tRNA synthetase [Thermoplasmatales archaeon BRNA1]|nr:isoleucyl-tRNA synthetase [Thermoplasmatales archaeon BRNA1]